MNHSTIYTTRTETKKKVENKGPRLLGPRIKPSTRVKKGPQCSHVETVSWRDNGSMASMFWDRNIEEELAKFNGHYTLSGQVKSQIQAQIWMITFSTFSGHTIRKPITGQIWVQRDKEKLLWTKAMILKDGRQSKASGTAAPLKRLWSRYRKR